MTGDYTRFTFDAQKRYSGVLMQQGRVQLDSDWNEQVDIIKRRLRTLALDSFGPTGLPLQTTPDAFRIGLIAGPPADLSIDQGRLYVHGWLAELFAGETATYLTQPFLPDPPALPASGDAVVYLDVWEREVTYVENDELLDVALGGADTATRTQTVWQVRVEARDGAVCGMDVGEPVSAGRLSSEAFAPPAPDDPCILPPLAGYRGLENRLYRVEVHDGGALGTARFKWSRDNGSIVAPVTGLSVAGGQTTLDVALIGRDPVMRFRIDDWVTVTDDHRELHGEPGEMARVVDIDEVDRRIVLDRVLPTGGGRPFASDAAGHRERHTRVQRWDQTAATNTVDGDGLVTTAAAPIDLEDGVRVSFDVDPPGGAFRQGDYWVFAARTADASVEELDRAPPRGIRHRYVQLAAITGLGGANPDVADCRPRPEDAAARCCCCLVTVGSEDGQNVDFTDLADAVAALPNLAPDEDVPVIVCLLEGRHELDGTVTVRRDRVTLRGCGWGTLVVVRQGPGLVLEGDEQAVQDLAMLAENDEPLIRLFGRQQRIAGCRLENQAAGPAVLAQRVLDLRVAGNLVLAQGGLDLAGDLIEVTENRVLQGPVRVREPSDTVRVRDNEILGAVEDAVIVGGRNVTYAVAVEGNRIRQAGRHGIASGFFDPEDEGRDGIVDGLRIAGNEIVECIGPNAVRQGNDPPFAGIALARVYDLAVHDNVVERNGTETRGPVCGIYVRHSRGAEFDRNVVRMNGARADGSTFPGPQAGISLRDAGVILTSLPDPADDAREVAELGIRPAAKVTDNLIDSRRGPALYIRGQGPMTVADNRFQATDILGDFSDFTMATVDQYVGTVFIYNRGLPGYLAGFLGGIGARAVTEGRVSAISGSPILTALIVGGQTQYRGNQARLDLARLENELVFANVAIVSFDDTVIAGNQSEGVLATRFGQDTPNSVRAPVFRGDIVLSDLFNLALTTRQSDNGLMSTPLMTIYSILSFGIFNHCIGNHTTSCILAVGTSPKSVVRDNAVIFPHPMFCPEDDQG